MNSMGIIYSTELDNEDICTTSESRIGNTFDKETEVPVIYIYIGNNGKEVVWLCVCQARCGTRHEELNSLESRI